MTLVFIKVYTTRSDGTELGETYSQTNLTASILEATKIMFLHYPKKQLLMIWYLLAGLWWWTWIFRLLRSSGAFTYLLYDKIYNFLSSHGWNYKPQFY